MGKFSRNRIKFKGGSNDYTQVRLLFSNTRAPPHRIPTRLIHFGAPQI